MSRGWQIAAVIVLGLWWLACAWFGMKYAKQNEPCDECKIKGQDGGAE